MDNNSSFLTSSDVSDLKGVGQENKTRKRAKLQILDLHTVVLF